MTWLDILQHAFAPGGVTVIGVLLAGYILLLRGILHIPDDKYVPREMYDDKAKEAADWKGIAEPAVQLGKEQADQLATLTDLTQRLVERSHR